MKKLTITIALMLVVALAMPAFGASFSDVPADHWAYNAINKLVAAGIVEGYPDGEYKGSQSMTRYEMAVMVSRALDNIVAEQKAMAEGLTTGQAEDVTAIVKSLMEKNTQDSLSDAQAEEVADIVDALTFELQNELKVLGARVDTLGKDVDDLEAKVEAMKVPEDNIEFSGTVKTVAQVGDYGDEPSATAEALADGDVLDVDLPRFNHNSSFLGAYNPIYDTNNNGVFDNGDDLPYTGNGGGDYDDFPAEEAFYQEIDLTVNGNYNGVNFDLVVDTVTNGFRDYDGYNYDNYDNVLGDQGDGNELSMDTALLTVSKDDWTFRAGDFEDYDVDDNAYFFDVEDAEGIEIRSPFYGTDLKAFAIGYDDGMGDNEYYGVSATKELTNLTLTGKLYHARVDFDGEAGEVSFPLLKDPANPTTSELIDNESITNIAVKAVNTTFVDGLTLDGEVVYNQAEEVDTSDVMVTVNADYMMDDVWSFRGGIETVGEEFNGGADYSAIADAVQADLEESYDYDKYNLGTTFNMNENNSLLFDAAMVAYDGASVSGIPGLASTAKADEDKMSYSLGWKNTYNKFENYAGVTFVENDYYTDAVDDDATIVKLGTVYDWTEKTKLRAGITHKKADLYDNEGVWNKDMEFTYLTAGVDHQLAENIEWITDVKYITGDVDQLNNRDSNGHILPGYTFSNNNADIDGSFITTSLSVSF